MHWREENREEEEEEEVVSDGQEGGCIQVGQDTPGAKEVSVKSTGEFESVSATVGRRRERDCTVAVTCILSGSRRQNICWIENVLISP